LPPFLVYFAVFTLVCVFVSFSIARLPFGIGNIFREILGSYALMLVLWIVVSILHLFLRLL
jgi:cellulose synthase/poly-beta-1,6-N-acetylglucosamine synthase-like glycosyltransferase